MLCINDQHEALDGRRRCLRLRCVTGVAGSEKAICYEARGREYQVKDEEPVCDCRSSTRAGRSSEIVPLYQGLALTASSLYRASCGDARQRLQCMTEWPHYIATSLVNTRPGFLCSSISPQDAVPIHHFQSCIPVARFGPPLSLFLYPSRVMSSDI